MSQQIIHAFSFSVIQICWFSNLRLETFLEDVLVLKMFRSCYYLQRHSIYVVVNIMNKVNMGIRHAKVQMFCANTVLFFVKGT